MIYAYDLGVQLPISSIYDTQMRLAFISAAKDMYEKAALEMKDFKKLYGDFYSSRQSDMDWYNAEQEKIRNTMNDLYARGIDPLRSVEGRIAMAKARDAFDIVQYAQRKKSAAVYDEYMKNKAVLDQKGLYNDEYEKWRLNKEDKSLDDVIFDLYSPAAFADEYALTNDIFKDMKPELIRTDNATGMDYFGVTMDRRRDALNANLDSILGTNSGRFMYELAANMLGQDATDADIRKAVADRILNTTSAAYDYATPKENPMAKRELDYKYAVRLHSANNQSDIDKAREIAKIKNDPEYNLQNNWTGRVRNNTKSAANAITGTPKTYRDYKDIHSMLQYRMPGDDSKGALCALAGSIEKQPIFPGSNIKGYLMKFGGLHDNLRLTESIIEDFAQSNFEGTNTRLKRSKAVDGLNDFLRINGIYGYAIDNKASALYNENGAYEVSFTMAVKKSDLDPFLKGRNEDALFKLIGATKRTDFGRKPKNSTLGWKGSEEYIDIPVTGIITGPDHEINASVANAVNRGLKKVNELEQHED